MLRFLVLAHPGARREHMEVVDDGGLAVWVRARPIEGQANEAIAQVIATTLGLRRRQVTLVAGTTSRRKIVDIDLPGLEDLRRRVLAHGLRSI